MSWICIEYFFSVFFPLAAKLIGPKPGCQFFKNVDFFDNHPLNAMAYLRDWWSLLAVVFVGQCEVLVCLGFVESISFLYFFPWPRSS